MDIFFLVLKQMLVMFIYIAIGFALRKARIVPDEAGEVISKLETYVLLPCLTFHTMLTKCNAQSFKENSGLILLGLILIIIAVGIAIPLSGVFVKNSKTDSKRAYERNIYKYAIALANFGFMGNYLVLSLFGSDGYFKYSMFTFFLTFVCNSWGLFLLIPKKEGKQSLLQSVKTGLLKPPVIALVLGVILGLLNIDAYTPDFVLTVFEGAGNCMGPLAMILCGIVIGGYNVKEMLGNRRVYIVSVLRLIVIPAALIGITKLLTCFDILSLSGIENVTALVLIAFATPLGLNTIVFPAAFGGETKTGASMALVSTVMSVITIPLMYYLFVSLIS